jgi:rhodanese-related sulfurtransferase
MHQVSGAEGLTCSVVATPSNVPSVTVAELRSARDGNPHAVLVDVRPFTQFRICSLRGSINIPLADLERNCESAMLDHGKSEPVFVICRRGVDSVAATAVGGGAQHDSSVTAPITAAVAVAARRWVECFQCHRWFAIIAFDRRALPNILKTEARAAPYRPCPSMKNSNFLRA